MQFLEVSLKDLPFIINQLNEKIASSGIKPTAIISIDKGGRLPGYYLADQLNIPQYSVTAHRKDSVIKIVGKKCLPLLPKYLRKYLREEELRLNSKRQARYVELEQLPNTLCGDILIIDDSLDSGSTIQELLQKLKNYLNNSINYYVAVINTTTRSPLIKPDFVVYENTILGFPWSKDSCEYQEFINLFNSIVTTS